MTTSEQKVHMRGVAAGIITGVAIGLIIALFITIKPWRMNRSIAAAQRIEKAQIQEELRKLKDTYHNRIKLETLRLENQIAQLKTARTKEETQKVLSNVDILLNTIKNELKVVTN